MMDESRSYLPYVPDGVSDWALPLPSSIQVGDVFTFAGRYQRRTLWEWLTRAPRRLQRFKITADVTAHGH